MARSDLVVALAKAGNAGDKRGARIATEAIIAEERAKQHKVLAEKLSKTMRLPKALNSEPVSRRVRISASHP
jgi:3-deoxy-D-arabino-heptulosonate 7-phosphate (DAHP) synthase class II